MTDFYIVYKFSHGLINNLPVAFSMYLQQVTVVPRPAEDPLLSEKKPADHNVLLHNQCNNA